MITRHTYTGLARYANLTKQFTLLRFKIKDQSTLLGLLWSFINPIVMLAVLFFMFNKKFGGGIRYYPAYLLVGIIQYNFFVRATASATTILFQQRDLTKNVVFPKETLVIGTIASDMVQFIFEMAVCMAFAIFLGAPLTKALLFIPAVILLELLITLWIGILLSCFHVFVKDIDNLWHLFSRVLFFITPVFFTTDVATSPVLKAVVFLNPLTALISYSRSAIIKGAIPPAGNIFMFILLNILLLYIAYKVFKRLEKNFAEYL